jgi:hypothetical protein
MSSSLSWASTSPKTPATRRRTKIFSHTLTTSGYALTLDKVQHEIIRFSHSHTPRAFTLTHSGDSLVCNHCCPCCCDASGETPRPSRSSSSPHSHSSSHTSSPRHTFSATAFPVNSFWVANGLDPEYHVFTTVLCNNRVSPTPRDFFVSLSCCWERTGIFPSEGSERGGLLFCFCLYNDDDASFSVSQGWMNFFSLPDGLRHLFGDHIPSSIFMCCVMHDLEGINDAYPQGVNLTLVGEIYFP